MHPSIIRYDLFKDHTNNAIVLSGDVHDSWAYTMKNTAGANVAVNIVAGGVTANGWGGVGGAVAAGLGNQVSYI